MLSSKHASLSAAVLTLLAGACFGQSVDVLPADACLSSNGQRNELLRVSNSSQVIACLEGIRDDFGGGTVPIGGYRTLSNSWVIQNTSDGPCGFIDAVYTDNTQGVSDDGTLIFGELSQQPVLWVTDGFLPATPLPTALVGTNNRLDRWGKLGMFGFEGIDASANADIFAATRKYCIMTDLACNESDRTAFALRDNTWQRIGPNALNPDSINDIVRVFGSPVAENIDLTASGTSGISADGSRIVGSSSYYIGMDEQIGHAFIANWDSVQSEYSLSYPTVGILTPQGYSRFKLSHFHDISSDGSVAVGAAEIRSDDGLDSFPRPFAWVDGTVVILPAPDGSALNGSYTSEGPTAYACNADGRIIVGSWLRNEVGVSAVLWIRTGTDFVGYWFDNYMQSVVGATLPDGILREAVDVSADGNTIVGWGEYNETPSITYSWITSTIVVLPTCGDLDFNNDTFFPDSSDLDDLLAVISGGPNACSTGPGLCDSIDINRDGIFPDTEDLTCLLTRLAGSTCPNCQ